MTTPCDQLIDLNGAGLRDAACAGDFGKFNGLMQAKSIYNLVHNNLGLIHRFSDYATLPPDQQDKVRDLLLVGVNLDNGVKTVFCDTSRYTAYDEGALCGGLSFAEAARASSSEPGIVTPFICPASPQCSCAEQPQCFVDGAVRESCPVKLVVRLAGCTRVLAVDLGYAGDRVQGVATQGLAEIINQSITIMGTQHFEADLHYLRTQVTDGDLKLSAYVLNPRLYDMGTFAFDRLPEAIRRGEETAEWFLQSVDKQLHIFRPDGTVDAERLFGAQGVFSYNYPDPDRLERRARLIANLARPQTQTPQPCRVEKMFAAIGGLSIAAVIAISLALFTVGGVVAMRLKPNAASLADVFLFWDGGLIVFLVGWLILYVLGRLWLCRSRGQS
jgi:predicted acylesterase/phospholipase RssA